MSTSDEEAIETLQNAVNEEIRAAEIDERAEALTREVSPAGTPLPEPGEFGSFKEPPLNKEEVDPKVLADQPQPAPPAPPRRLRFTVLCGRKVGSDEDNVYRRDIAAVHIMGADLPEARVNAITLLAANVIDTTVDDWEPIIGYLGHLEIL